jgi:hypothetical protein
VRRARAAYLEDLERAVMAESEGEGWELLDAGQRGVGVENSGEMEEEQGDEEGDQERNESCRKRGGHDPATRGRLNSLTAGTSCRFSAFEDQYDRLTCPLTSSY